jgi:cellulose synthase/poly-beta-1,6-N-acetylglucosamine synthase-like glycosyltransferase
MYLSVLGMWALCAVLIDPRLLGLLAGSDGLIPKGVVLLFSICLNLFWLFGSYYLMLGIFSLISQTRRPRPPELKEFPKVAVLYATMNDFQKEAALSCIRQKYPHFHVFILDDSLDNASKARADEFARQHTDKVTVIRRPDRVGYKAGSLNHALRLHVKDFPYFAVVDADSILPETFIADLLPYFCMGDDIGYVQGSHRPNPHQKSQFAKDLSLGIIPLWTVYYGPRNRFGNVIFLGHGGIIRYDVWQATGGFPEIVSEDLAFSTRAAQLGYRGYFAHNVVSYEDFPMGYRQLRRQQEKYVKGACEYFHKEFCSLLRNPSVKWYEKLDVLLSCSSLLVPVLFMVFMLTYCVIIPLIFCTWKPVAFELGGRQLFSCPVLMLKQDFYRLWSWDFYAITALCTIAPMFGCFSLILRYPFRGLKMLLLSAVPYLSLMVVASAALVSYLLSHKASFLVTGDRWGADPQKWPRDFSPKSPVSVRMGSEDWGTRMVEVILGVILIIMCVLSLNLCLLAFALATFLGPILFKARWESRALRPLLYAPFLLICAGLALTGTDLIVAQGAFAIPFLFHF